MRTTEPLIRSSLMKRRTFLKLFGSAALFTPLGKLVPHSFGAVAPENQDHVLIIVELLGGNDGLNTVVPFDTSPRHSVFVPRIFKRDTADSSSNAQLKAPASISTPNTAAFASARCYCRRSPARDVGAPRQHFQRGTWQLRVQGWFEGSC